MKLRILTALAFFTLVGHQLSAQDREFVNPIIKNYGGILDLPDVDVKPDPDMEYKILIEEIFKMDRPDRVNFSAMNVARLINLHAVGGVKKENLKVTLVIHGMATNTVVNNEAYQGKYSEVEENPYIKLYKELAESGVELIVCGQSLTLQGHTKADVIPEVKIATSALTAVTTYQLKGYAYFKWD